MADRPPSPETRDDTGVGPSPASTAGTPRWVKVFGVIVIVLVLLVAVLLLTGVGGLHGPARHIPTGDALGQGTPSSVTDPPGGDGDIHDPLRWGHA